jgi:hypothetical protein
LAKITHLFLSDEQIRRAAEEMLDKHGEGCLGIVTEQIGICRPLAVGLRRDHAHEGCLGLQGRDVEVRYALGIATGDRRAPDAVTLAPRLRGLMFRAHPCD